MLTYPQNGSPTGTPTNGVTLGPVTFSGTNTIAVSSGAKQVYVLCGTKCVRIIFIPSPQRRIADRAIDGHLELVGTEDERRQRRIFQ